MSTNEREARKKLPVDAMPYMNQSPYTDQPAIYSRKSKQQSFLVAQKFITFKTLLKLQDMKHEHLFQFVGNTSLSNLISTKYYVSYQVPLQPLRMRSVHEGQRFQGACSNQKGKCHLFHQMLWFQMYKCRCMHSDTNCIKV